jgi:biotin synthase
VDDALLDRLVRRALDRAPQDPADVSAVLAAPDDAVLDVVAAAARVRRRFFGNRVKLAYLVNLRSGLCPEDCGYCSQRLGSAAEVLTYPWLTPEQTLAAAGPGITAGATRVCLVASGRGPSQRDVARVADVCRAIKEHHPGVEVCACLGLLRDGQADALREAGVDAYNHNLNTAEERYADICTTHAYADRVGTVERVRDAGLTACSGLVAGMGEQDDEVVEVLLELRRLGARSVPVNFLMPFEGTPLAGRHELTPQRCLLLLAAARFVCPDAEIRVAAGRELHLRTLQPLALHVASSLFLGDYLTSEGRPGSEDLAMIADAGMVVEVAATEQTAVGATTVDDPPPPVVARRRGAGTALRPNA